MKQLEGMLETYFVPKGETLQYKQGLYELLIDSSDFVGGPFIPTIMSGSDFNPSPIDYFGMPLPRIKSIEQILEEMRARAKLEEALKEKPQNFEATSQSNLETSYNLGQITGNPLLKPYSLTERHDFSGHDNQPPHLNQDLINDAARRILNSGTSKKSQDGYKGLGAAHNIPYDEDENK